MNLTLMATVLWAAGFLLNAALLFVLIFKRRYRTVPWFTAFVGAGCVYTLALFLGYRYGSKHLYAVLYWACDFLDLLLQISVIFEIAGTLMKRSGRWVEGARLRLGLMAATAPVLAGVMTALMTPAAETRIDAISARASLFTTILIFVLFVSVVVACQQLGLGWQSYPMRIGYGMMVWVAVAFITDTLHAYWGTLGHFSLLENIRIVVFKAVTVLWCLALWLPETVPQPMGEEERKRLELLKRRLEYGQH